jgi:hypothetical protein
VPRRLKDERLTLYALRLRGYAMHYALCAMRDVEATMPAIASLEDLKAAQKEGLSIYAMLYALCSMLYEDGGALGGKMSVSYGFRSGHQNN